MSLSLFLRKALVWGGAAGLLASSLTVQAQYLPLGQEAPIAGVLPGNQSSAQASVGVDGGFLVWADNVTDGNGSGISAVGLNSALGAAQAPFRVNVLAAGDQESPAVALLKDGGAVFVWVGGQAGFQSVYARFLGKDNTWATGEILISASGRPVKGAPSVTVLGNGNVLVTYSAYNQRTTTSMLDVYGQILTPAGTKVGQEISINQFASYNQRNPVAAPLSSGGFVVSWVTEQQRRQAVVSTNVMVGPDVGPSVDVYARVFNDAGTAQGNEILVNGEGVLCANPAVAATADGGYIVAWSQGYATNISNPWDIAARVIAPGSGAPGDVVIVNSFTRGKQYSPTIANIGNDYLIAWVSAQQDGSGDGVFAQYLNPALAKVGGEFRVNSGVRLDQNQPFATSDKSGRFLVLWRTGEWAEQVTIETCGKIFAKADYQVGTVSTNYVGPVFVMVPDNATTGGSTTGSTADSPTLEFPVAAKFGQDILLDAFPRSKGNYQGLIYNTQGIKASDSGYVTSLLAEDGRFSIRFQFSSRAYTFSSKFDWDGKASKQIAVTGRSPIQVNVEVDMAAGNEMRGTFVDGTSTYSFLAKRSYYTKSAPCALAGRYNVAISAPESTSSVPMGQGYGSLLVYSSGKALFSGKLADGTVVTQNATVAEDGTWALYAAPYSRKGVVIGWMEVAKAATGGKLIWIKPANATKYYPNGFISTAAMSGSQYSVQAGKSAMQSADGSAQFVFGTGTFATGLTCPVKMTLDNRILDTAATGLKAVLSVPTGTFTGSFISPTTNRRVSFSGKLLTGQNTGSGFFLDNNLSGQVLFTSPAP